MPTEMLFLKMGKKLWKKDEEKTNKATSRSLSCVGTKRIRNGIIHLGGGLRRQHLLLSILTAAAAVFYHRWRRREHRLLHNFLRVFIHQERIGQRRRRRFHWLRLAAAGRRPHMRHQVIDPVLDHEVEPELREMVAVGLIELAVARLVAAPLQAVGKDESDAGMQVEAGRNLHVDNATHGVGTGEAGVLGAVVARQQHGDEDVDVGEPV